MLATIGFAALAGCGGGSDAAGAAPPVTTPAPTPPAPPAPAPAATPLPDALSLSVPPYVEPGDAVAITSSQGAGVSGLTYAWDFGDGRSATSATVAPRSYAAGHYMVTLTVRNEAGATRSASAQLLVGPQGESVRGLQCTKADGKGWCRQSANVTSIYLRTATSGWATEERGLMLKTEDGGVTWDARPTGTNWSLYNTRFADERTGWVLGVYDKGTAAARLRILKTVDAGATWTEQPLAMDSSGTLVLSRGTGGPVLSVVDSQRAIVYDTTQAKVTRDGGATWAKAAYLPAHVMPSGRTWHLSSVGTLLVSDDLGLTISREVVLPGRIDAVQFVDDRIGAVHVRPSDPAMVNGHLIYRTTDGGITWMSTGAQGLPDLMTSGSDRYTGARIVTSNANVMWLTLSTVSFLSYYRTYRSTDAGATWTGVPFPDGRLVGSDWSIFPVSANAAWYETFGSVHLTRDVGVTWSRLTPEGPTTVAMPVYKSMGDRSEALFVAIPSNDPTRQINRWFRTADGGATWAQTFAVPAVPMGSANDRQRSAVTSSHFFDRSHWLASVGFNLYETFDGGRKWMLKLAGSTFNPFKDLVYGNKSSRIQFVSPQQGWALMGGGISQTVDGGLTWMRASLAIPMGDPVAAHGDIDYRTDGKALAVNDVHHLRCVAGRCVEVALVSVSKDVGGWDLERAVNLLFVPKSVRWVSSSVALIAGAGGRIARSADGGITWNEVNSPVTKDLLRLLVTSEQQAWAVGDAGTVLRTQDGGLTWQIVPVPTQGRLADVVFADPVNGYLVGDAGTLLATHDGGTTWALQTTGTSEDLGAIYSPAPGELRMLTREGQVYASSTGGY